MQGVVGAPPLLQDLCQLFSTDELIEQCMTESETVQPMQMPDMCLQRMHQQCQDSEYQINRDTQLSGGALKSITRQRVRITDGQHSISESS